MCFFFNDTATTEIYTLSLHDALPILAKELEQYRLFFYEDPFAPEDVGYFPMLRAQCAIPIAMGEDRKSTRLNSSHANISYAVFCLKKKKHAKSRPQPLSPGIPIAKVA